MATCQCWRCIDWRSETSPDAAIAYLATQGVSVTDPMVDIVDACVDYVAEAWGVNGDDSEALWERVFAKGDSLANQIAA
jgi:hypothetical protein